MVLRKALDKDPQFLAGLELVRDSEMYKRIITPADAKVTSLESWPVNTVVLVLVGIGVVEVIARVWNIMKEG